jgi:hypothetical protein
MVTLTPFFLLRERSTMRRVLLCVVFLLLYAPACWAGYAHNWTWKKAPDPVKVKKCIEDMRKVLYASPVPLAGTDGDGKPFITDEVLAFNMKGSEKEIGEPFIFPGKADPLPGLNFCKTNGKPYDVVTVACLLVAMDHFSKEDISIGSDGHWSEGAWDAGVDLYKKVFGRDPHFSRDAGFSGIVSNINLVPSWNLSQLWIAAGLLAFGALALWYFFNPRPDFQIYLQPQGNPTVNGKFPQAHLDALRSFFQQDLTVKEGALVKGWYFKDGQVKLDISGSLSDREQQRVRNFISSLRLSGAR